MDLGQILDINITAKANGYSAASLSTSAASVISSAVSDSPSSDLTKIFCNAITIANDIIKKIQQIAKQGFDHLRQKVGALSLKPIIATTNILGTDIEKIFNVVSCLPFLGMIGSAIRVVCGKVQIIAGLALSSIAEVGLFLERKENESVLRGKWLVLSKLGLEQVLHGCLNVLRGTGETILSSYTFGVGNVFLLAPNMCNKREFNPYLEYGTLVSPKDVLDRINV